ncbi:MAG: penicillin-binding protein activator [Rhodanobacter sp.]
MQRMRLSHTTAIGLLLSLALTACVPLNVQPTAAEVGAAQSAATMAKQGQLNAAAQAYLALAAQSPRRADHYRLLAAEALRQEGQMAQAAPIFAQIARSQLRGDEPLRLDLLRAEWALSQHDAKAALQLTTQPTVTVPGALQLRLLELRARAMAASNDPWGSAVTRVQMDDQLSGLDRAQNRQQALALLNKVGAESLQQRAAAMKPGDHMLPWINVALTQLGVAIARAQPALAQSVGTLLPGPDATVREGYKVPKKLALLLPDDGNLAAASSAIREGFFAAYIDAGRNNAPRPDVRTYNSHGTAAGAIKAYQQAVSDGAQLIVGPLTRGEVAAVFGQAKLPVPILALNHPDGRQLSSGEASEFGLLPETEGAQTADHMVALGLRQAYILVSADDFAHRAATAFKAEFVARGGDVHGLVTLPSGSVSYADVINQLNATGAAADAGIFISMRPAQARMLVPQLKIAQVNLPIFATSHVYAGSDDAGANRDLDGVEFCDAPWLFDAQPGLPNRAAIAAQLPVASGGGARLFAFGMDAWNLVPYLDWLHTHPGSYLPGATGQLTADQFGRVHRVLTWAKFQDGLAHTLNGSLQTDDLPATTPATSTPAPPSLPAPSSNTPPGTE